jgi:hypothetical protein
MRKKSLILLIHVGLALLLVAAPLSSARDVENHGTIYVGEEHLNLKFLEGSNATKMFGWWPNSQAAISTAPSKMIRLENSYTDVSFPAEEFAEYTGGIGFRSMTVGYTCDVDGPWFILALPKVTPTPVPTPSEGNIIISSSPSDATVYVDNAIKGITPLTVTVANGEHVVRIKLDGYYESKTGVTVIGKDVSIEPVLIPVTTVATTIPTTIQTTVTTTTPTSMPTTTITAELTTIPTTTTINYSRTIAAMQKQIDEQVTKNAEQDVAIAEQSEQIGFIQQMIDSILGFLGLK